MTETIDDAVWPASGEGRLDLNREIEQIGSATALLEQAKGVLIFRYGIDACSAFKLIERWAAAAKVGIEKVAHALVRGICQGDPAGSTDRRLVRWLEDQLRHEFPEGEESPREPSPVTVAVDQFECSLDAVVQATRKAARLGVPLQITVAGALDAGPDPQRAHLAQRVDLAVELARSVSPAVEVRRPVGKKTR